MGKARIAAVFDQKKESPPPYAPELIRVTTPCRQLLQQTEKADHAGAVVWYVISILSTICCFFPCNIIGLVHAMISKHEAERGNIAAHKRRLHQAKCWTGWSIGLGLATLITVCILMSVCSGSHRMDRGRNWKTDAVFDGDDSKPSYMWQGQRKVTPGGNSSPFPTPITDGTTVRPANTEFPELIGQLVEDWYTGEDDEDSSSSSSSSSEKSDDSSLSEDRPDCDGCGGHDEHEGGYGGTRGGGYRGGHRGGRGGHRGSGGYGGYGKK